MSLLGRGRLRITQDELAAAGITFEREKPYPVTYRGQLLSEHRLDFVVGGAIVVEIKSPAPDIGAFFLNTRSMTSYTSPSGGILRGLLEIQPSAVPPNLLPSLKKH